MIRGVRRWRGIRNSIPSWANIAHPLINCRGLRMRMASHRGVGAWLLLAAAWTFTLTVNRGNWSPSSLDTASFVELSVRRPSMVMRSQMGARPSLFVLALLSQKRIENDLLLFIAFTFKVYEFALIDLLILFTQWIYTRCLRFNPFGYQPIFKLVIGNRIGNRDFDFL